MNDPQGTRILLVIPNLGGGGAQGVFRQQLQLLSGDYLVTGCVFNWDGALDADRTDQVISLDVPAGKNFVDKVWQFFVRTRRLRRLKRRLNIRVSISHLEGADYANLLSGIGEGRVCWIHGTKEFDRNIGGMVGAIRTKILMPLLYRRADKIVAVSRAIGEEVERINPSLKRKLTVIHNGFDFEKIDRMSREPVGGELAKLFSGTKTLITHCRLARQKNLSAMLKIFSLLNTGTNIKLIILGDGELRQHLLKESESLGLPTWNQWEGTSINVSCKVFFIGYQSNPFRLIRLASLYLMTSLWEGFPLSLGEAIACGLPVLAADCPTGPREILGFQNLSDQPVDIPCYNENGVLMPMVEVSNQARLRLWVSEVEKRLGHANGKDRPVAQGVKAFSQTTALTRTVNLIRGLRGA